VKKIKVVLAGMPSMMTELIEQILAPYPEFRIAARVPAGQDLASAARRYRADILIILQRGRAATDAELDRMFSRRPSTVITITEGGREGMVHVLRPRGSALGELSAESLVAAARAASNT
jgi:hypothetical protein